MVSYRSAGTIGLAVLLVVLAGCSGAPASGSDGASPTVTPTLDGAPTDSSSSVTDTRRTATSDGEGAPSDNGTASRTADGSTPTDGPPASPRPDPDDDVLGWEAGYWYDDPVAVDQSDGYNATERERVIARTMARLERLREMEFTESVETEVITREQFRERNPFRFRDDPARDQVWEALFAVGENQSSAAALQGVYGGNVAGYYSDGKIVLVTDDPGSVELDRRTLSHELVHALQDQQLGMRYPDGKRDEALAYRAITEGEANYLMDRYARQCDLEWSCIPAIQRASGASGANQAIFLAVFLPYSDGPTLVEALVDREGWAAVTAAWEDRPVSTEQVIHPEKYPEERPVEVSVPDRSNNRWKPMDTRERVGEASMFAMFLTNGVIPRSQLRTGGSRYNYSHPITAGWGGDSLVPYSNDGRYGYVFETAWDTRRDAHQFHEAYLDLLENRGATEVRSNVYRIRSGPYADAFRVVREGRTVRVVNAPTVGELDGVHAPG